MKAKRAKELLKTIRRDLPPPKSEVSEEEVRAKLGWWNAWRLIRSWGPRAKGKRAFFEVKEKGKGKYLNLINDVERNLMNIQGFESSMDLRIVWKAAHLEGIRTETRLKRHGVVLSILGILLGILFSIIISFLGKT